MKAEQSLVKKQTKGYVIGAFFRKNLTAWILLLPSVLLFYFLVWRPIGIGFGLSMFKLERYQPVKFVGFANFADVLSDTLFIKTLINTFSYVGWSLIIGYFPPILLAIVLNEIVHFKSAIKFAIYFPQIVPTVAAALIWYFLYLPGESGILNILLMKVGLEPQNWLQNPAMTIPLIIVSMTWQGCGGSMLLYLASLQGINQELYEAAKMDGAGFFRRLFNITIPSVFPIMLLCFVKQIISVFQILTEPMTMTGGGPNNASVSLNLQSFDYAFTYFQPERALALGVITFLILIVVTCFYFRLQKKYE